jgi:IS30 family transposase
VKQLNNNIKSRRGKHLIYSERCKLEVLLKQGYKPKEIGEILERDRRTIERERAKGLVELDNGDGTTRIEYSADIGQQKHDINATNKGPTIKLGKDHKLARYIEQKIIEEKYSPEAVLGEIKIKKIEFKTTICVKTLYSYIDKGIFLRLTNKNLLIKKNAKKRIYNKVRGSIKNIKGTSIEERTEIIENREEFGHWEMDTVVGRRSSKEVLLVLSERQTREEIIIKLRAKIQEQVEKAIDNLEKKYKEKFKEIFKTITVDNGSEFLDFEGIEDSKIYDGKRTKVYYAHPYSAWERGTNENINKMIRRFIPKGSDISKYTEEEIERIQNWINNYPRKILGFHCSNTLFNMKLAA